VAQPLLEFLARHTDPAELAFFAELASAGGQLELIELPEAKPLVLIPAFLVTELTEALAMAVYVLVPFLVVDLVVAQVLVLGGLTNQPAAAVTLPLKVLLFLAVGGWDAVIGGIIGGYR
jgi:flagellar biosynthesis protein FliP